MSAPRGLSEEEARAWEKVAETVTPLEPAQRRRMARIDKAAPPIAVPPSGPVRAQSAQPTTHRPDRAREAVERGGSRRPTGQGTLDSHWDRRIRAGTITPDFTLDLHGHGLDAAYTRLLSGIAQARAMGARTILLVTGKPRPVDPADRGSRRGAIRAKVLDWLAASQHADAIAAIRKAHRHHGGDGALYIVLRKGT